MNQKQTVFVVDDEPAITKAISRLLTSEGYTTSVFGSAEEFMQKYIPGSAGCLLLDLSMPGITGLDLQSWLAKSGYQLPTLFLTGVDDLGDSEQTMIDQGVELLRKPVDTVTLIRAIEKALTRDRIARSARPLEGGYESAQSTPPA